MKSSGIKLSDLQKVKKTSSQKRSFNISDYLNREISFSSQFSDGKKEEFYRQLHVLLQAGVDLRMALQMLGTEGKGKQHQLFMRLHDYIVSGNSFTAALDQEKKFSQYEVFSVQIGEETGKLIPILKELSLFFKYKKKQKRQFVSALSYPLVVLFTASMVVLFMVNFIVPMFNDVFKTLNHDLPAITKFILNVSSFFSNYWLVLLSGFIGVGIIFFRIREKIWWKVFSSKLLLKIPVFGELLRKIYLTRFCSAMSLLINSKVPILTALKLVQKMISFYPIQLAVTDAEKGILKGMPLYTCLRNSKVFPAKMISLIKVGEEVNRLDEFFFNLSEQLTEEVEHQMSLLSTVLEPLLIVFIGLVVGFILVAMYMPIFQISSSF